MIVFDGVSKQYGAVRALDSVSLELRPGERVGIVGTNGSGKTTLLRALLGLVRVEGRVTIGGHDVARDPERALAHVAYAPQIAPPLDAPVEELVRLQCRLRSVERAQVVERARRLGLDLAAVSRTRFRDLSGGMKQKALAALALAANAPVLVCDEPTANLDASARTAFFAQVGERGDDAMLVLCSHRADEIRHLVDRVVELRDGRVVRDAPISELIRDVPTTRIEVRTRGGADVDRWLRDRGFDLLGSHRYAGRFRHDEKLDLMQELLRVHAAHLDDVAMFDEGEISGFSADEEPTSSPRRIA